MPNNVSRRIIEARKVLGLSQAEAAALCSCSVKSWGWWEKGEREPGSEILEKLGSRSGHPVWWFFASDEELAGLGYGVSAMQPDYDPTRPAPELGKASVRGKGRKEELIRTEPEGGIQEAARRVKVAQEELNLALAALEKLYPG